MHEPGRGSLTGWGGTTPAEASTAQAANSTPRIIVVQKFWRLDKKGYQPAVVLQGHNQPKLSAVGDASGGSRLGIRGGENRVVRFRVFMKALDIYFYI